MKLLINFICVLLIGIGLKLQVSPFVHIPRSSAVINIGEYHSYIGIVVISVGVALFLKQKYQK